MKGNLRRIQDMVTDCMENYLRKHPKQIIPDLNMNQMNIADDKALEVIEEVDHQEQNTSVL